MQILFIIVLLIYVFSIIYYYKNRKKLFEKYIKRKKHEIEEQISKRTIYKDSLEYVIESREKNLQVLEDCLRQGQHQKEVLFKELEEYERQQMESINHHVEIIKEAKTNEALVQLEKERKQAEAEFECLKREKQNEIDTLSAQLQSYQANKKLLIKKYLDGANWKKKLISIRFVCLMKQ